jgi:hypothetical protein
MSEKAIGVKLPAHDWGVVTALIDSVLLEEQLTVERIKYLVRIREAILEALGKAEKWPADW